MWCDELIVVDDESTDKTSEIAKEYGTKVFQNRLLDDFSKQRNFGLDKARGGWVLFVDADETVTEELKEEITGAIKESKFDGYFVKRKDYIWGRELNFGETSSVKFLRLARKGGGKWEGVVHEEWKIKGKVGELKSFLNHYPHQTLFEFIKEIDYYSILHAESKYKNGQRSNLLKILFFPILKFGKNWILRRGFLEGTEGFLVAALMSFHSFLTWSKLWLIQRKYHGNHR